ncbi:MAG: RNA 2',3'-cyclic phosphodiesterase [Deltaproteobacteria bacterium]|nr:RNA 2',3'-cyclic phosphodiesterase [Deltaproteobacteria bacterium]MBW2396536.1 RNA 2',3'-cyclic phosphodiesterase [Deltaproteobacteria bacterium]
MSFGRRQGSLVRSFIAVPLPEPVRVGCAALAVDLAGSPGGEGVRWAHSEGYHVTLRFLGNVASEELQELGERLTDVVAEVTPFSLSLSAPFLFPKGRRAKVVALGLAPEGPLAELAACVERAASASGFEPDSRGFHAHLTLGRIRNRRVPALEEVSAPAAPWTVSEVVLYRSDLARDGAHYEALTRCPLGSEMPAAAVSLSP